MKRTLTTTSKYGTFTRNTARNYTHVVLVDYGDGWRVVSWCSRYDLAVKAMNDWARRYREAHHCAIVLVDN